MRKITSLLLALAVAASCRTLPGQKAAASVVTIEAFDSKGRKVAQGSGFVVKSTALVITCDHVIDGAARAEVILPEGGRRPVSGVLHYDSHHDFAILQVDGLRLPGLTVSKREPAVGAPVFAFGAPLALSGTLTPGYVNAIRPHHERGYPTLQHSAIVAPGSSGGPLLDESGNVIGINTHFLGPFSFALPIHHARLALAKRSTPKSLAEVNLERHQALAARIQDNRHYFTYHDPAGFTLRLPLMDNVDRRQFTTSAGLTVVELNTNTSPFVADGLDLRVKGEITAPAHDHRRFFELRLLASTLDISSVSSSANALAAR